MKIRTRIALTFTLIVSSLLLFFAVAVYYFSSNNRRVEFFERLNEKANNYAQLTLKFNKTDQDLVKIIDKNTAYLHNEHIYVYDSKYELLFSTTEKSDNISTDFLDKIKQEKVIKNKSGSDELLGIAYKTGNDFLVVIVSATDIDGFNKLNSLRIILGIGLLVCVFITMLVGWIFSGHALNPISEVIKEVENINAENLMQRVSEGNGKDEIALMAITFNQMLDRLQHSFELQKSFVANSSHELRTPLTSITGQLEVALMSNKSTEEYRRILESLLEDINVLNKLTNGLLDLAQMEMNHLKLNVTKVRVDELLWSVQNTSAKRNPDFKINIDILAFPENESYLEVYANEQLLKSAFINIIDNARKFSKSKQVNVLFNANNNFIEVSFLDDGIGISAAEINKISQPFFRASNARTYQGHGLGLSMVYKIISMYNGKVKIESKLNEFTKVILRFNRDQALN